MRDKNLTRNSNKEMEKEVSKLINFEVKTKKDLLNLCDECIKEKKGLRVYIKIPGNKALEVIENVPEDIENKKKYYEITYDEDLKHKTAPIKIHSADMLNPLIIPNHGEVIISNSKRKVKKISLVKVVEVEFEMESDEKNLMPDRAIKTYQTLDGQVIGTVDSLRMYDFILNSDYLTK